MSVLRIVFPIHLFTISSIDKYFRQGTLYKARPSLLITPLNSDPLKGVQTPV